MTKDMSEELKLLGAAVYMAQKVEFALYGTIAHLTHIPEIAKLDRRLKGLDGEKFLRGDPEELKITLGQLVTILGNHGLLSSEPLNQFVKDRNLIAHGYFRHFHYDKDGQTADAEGFLADFVKRALEFQSVILGFIHFFREAMAEKHGAGHIETTEADKAHREAYLAYVEKHHLNKPA